MAGRIQMLGGCMLLGMLGCQSKISECNKLAQIVNQGVSKIEAVENQAVESTSEYASDAKSVAALADQTAAAIAALQIETTELKPKAETYQAVAKDMAEVSREFADLMDKAQEVKDERLAAADTKFSGTQAELEKLCNAGNHDCTKLRELLDKQPEDPQEAELAGVLGAYADDLEELGRAHLAASPLEQAIDEHVAAARDYKTVLEDWSALEAQVDAAEEKLDAIVAREDAIVADLNKFCVGS